MASDDMFSNYLSIGNSVNADPDTRMSEDPIIQQNITPPRHTESRERGLYTRSDLSNRRDERNLQEIEITLLDQDSDSAKQRFTGTANVSNKTGLRSRKSDASSEYITTNMFKTFMDAHNKQMETMQKSLDSLNEFYYEDISEGEDDYFSEEEEEGATTRKRQRTDQVSRSPSPPRNPIFSSARAPSQSETRLGGSDFPDVNNDEVNFDTLLSKKLDEFSSEEKVGPKVKDSLAKMINSLLTTPMDQTKKNELMDKFLRPDNCNLNYPRVNDVIWDLCINGFGRALDTKLHTIQKSLLKGLTPIINVVHNLLENPEGLSKDSKVKQESIVTLLDGIAMLSSTSYDLSIYRRMNIKQFLNEQYSSLCSKQTPLTDMLFGDNVCDKIDSLTKGQKVAALVSSENFPTGFTSRGRGGSGGRYKRRGGFRAKLAARGRTFLGRKSSNNQHRRHPNSRKDKSKKEM